VEVSARVTTLALATLEGVADTLGTGRAGAAVVAVAARVTLVALATLEGEANTGGAGAAVATVVSTATVRSLTTGGVTVAARVATLALATLEGVADTRSRSRATKVGVATSSITTVSTAAAIARAGAESSIAGGGRAISTMAEAALIATLAFTSLESKTNLGHFESNLRQQK